MLANTDISKKMSSEGPGRFPSELATSVVNLRTTPCTVPSLLVDCFNYIRTEGVVEGIFRVSGSVRKIKEISKDFSTYQDWLSSDVKKPSPHDVCGFIKLFLREYFTFPNCIFLAAVSSSIKRLYLSGLRRGSEMSGDSCHSAVSLLSIPSTSVSVEENSDQLCDLDVNTFATSVVHILLSKNSSKKNELFFFLIHILKELLVQKEITKMTPQNYSIIFQPYVFSSNTLSDLSIYQEILSILIVNEKQVIEEYTKSHMVLGDLDETETELFSVSSLYSPSKTSSTGYLSLQPSPTTKPVSGSGGLYTNARFSLSQKFYSFLDNYNISFNKPKRLSVVSRSLGKSDEDLPNINTSVCSHSNMSIDSLETDFVSRISFTKESVLKLPDYTDLPFCSEERESKDETGSTRRNSTFRKAPPLFLPHLSLNNAKSTPVEAPSSYDVSRMSLNLDKFRKENSVDDLLLSCNEPGQTTTKRKAIGRRLSLWIKKI